MMAAIGAVPVCKVYYNKCYEKIGFLDFGCRGALNLRGLKKWECGGLRGFPETQRAVAPVEEDGKALVAPAAKTDEETEVITNSRGFHKDMNGFPRPLSSSEVYKSPIDGSKVRIAYQGVPGAYSEAAALKAYPACEPVPCDQFEAVFKAVELWLVDKAIIPVENSVGGSVHRNYDLLLTHRLHIVGEVQMVVNHCLLGLPGVRKEEIKSVLSHPQALYQCEMSLKELGVTKLSTSDTAGAAQIIAAEGVRETGAIASAKAAEIYGLNVLADRMQDYNDNITRFLILSREPIIPGTRMPYKTSIVFSLEEGPGVLFKALAVFALRDINMLKIESRPLRNQPLRIVDGSSNGMYFDYLFYLDFEASMAEQRAQNALGHLQEMAKFIRVLGSYPMCTTL